MNQRRDRNVHILLYLGRLCRVALRSHTLALQNDCIGSIVSPVAAAAVVGVEAVA